MNPKLVSIIIPTYNRADRVLDAIHSIRQQTYKAWQIIVIDDGSDDDTPQKLANLEDVEYYYKEHKGQGAARNFGLSKAKGDYIASLDSDDVWHKNFLTESVAFLEKHNLDFVFSNWITNKVSGTSISVWERNGNWKKYMKHKDGEWFLLKPPQVRRLFLETCPAPSSSLLIRRDALISGWNEEMLIADDWCLILEMVLTRYCHAAFTTSPFWTKNIHNENIYDGRELIKIIQELGLHDEVLMASIFDSKLSFIEKRTLRKRLAGHYLDFGHLNWKQHGISKHALQSIATSVRLSPIGIFSLLATRLNWRLRSTARTWFMSDKSK